MPRYPSAQSGRRHAAVFLQRNSNMDSQTNIQTSATRRLLLRPSAGYRVMARHRDQGQSLVTLAENLRQAVTRAKAFCDTIATNRDGIVSVRVEEWVGTDRKSVV